VWFDIGICEYSHTLFDDYILIVVVWNWMPGRLRELWQQYRIRIYHQQDFLSSSIFNTIWNCSPMLERKGCAVQDDLGC